MLRLYWFQLFNIYIKKAAEIYGVPKTRQIYEKAIEALHEDNCREMCLRFAEMETKLGEIDRARAIYAHCSQVCDPRVSFTNSFDLDEFALENSSSKSSEYAMWRLPWCTWNTVTIIKQEVNCEYKRWTVQHDRICNILGNLLGPQKLYLIETRENCMNFLRQQMSRESP